MYKEPENKLRIEQEKILEGERAGFSAQDVHYVRTIFQNGESPLKHSKNVIAEDCLFKWKYPFWYADNVWMKGGVIEEMGRAGVWYTDNARFTDVMVEAPKEFRRCKGLELSNVSIPDAEETLWNCSDVTLRNVTAKGPYFGMGTENAKISGLTLYGDYCFDGAKNVEVHDSRFLSKDCFWNAENITIYDSYISGEYLAWNSKNVTLVNCTIESLQGMCYIENLVMKNCTLINTTLAFEYSTVDCEITSAVDSILNPTSGTIRAGRIGELILEKDRIDPGRTKIVCRDIEKQTDHVDYAY